jgi:hypothetical protein
MQGFSAASVVLFCAGLLSAASNNLQIYFVDVEGGGATLIVTPAGESMLVDTGNPGNDDRDAKRIYAAAPEGKGSSARTLRYPCRRVGVGFGPHLGN